MLGTWQPDQLSGAHLARVKELTEVQAGRICRQEAQSNGAGAGAGVWGQLL